MSAYQIVRKREDIKNPHINAAVALNGTPAIRVYDPDSKWKAEKDSKLRHPVIFLLLQQCNPPTKVIRGPLWVVDWGFEKLRGLCLRCIRLNKTSECTTAFSCYACNNVSYCSAAHRLYDWPRHSQLCEETNFEWDDIEDKLLREAIGGRGLGGRSRELRPECELCYGELRDPEESRRKLREWCDDKERRPCGEYKARRPAVTSKKEDEGESG